MESKTEEIKIPDEFRKIIKDLVRDILITFPEYKERLNEHIVNIVTYNDRDDEAATEVMNVSCKQVFEYCKKVFPERFFDILYQNVDMFTNPNVNTEFLPDISFGELWNADISDKTRETIWKYLQLLLFTVITSVNNDTSFGDTAKLFEAIDESELKGKLEETMKHMHDMFDMSGVETDSAGMDASGVNMENLPNPEEIHEHISGMLDGKLGNLAKEIAAETAEDLNMDMDAPANVNDIFEKLFKNPGRLMGLVQNVGKKLDTKLKSGELKESELIQEAQELMKKMKDMPGLGNFQEMMSKMNGGGKVNMGAMNAKMAQNLRQAKMKERMQDKLRKKQEEQAAAPPKEFNPSEMEHTKFTTGDSVQKTPLNPDAAKKGNKKKRRKGAKK
ncbi:MAG: hypothetical protein ACXABD_00730 [Candidatus Thorarchaeota archaeon]|jgi:hypothetical protein